jgi:hypothetical protein
MVPLTLHTDCCRCYRLRTKVSTTHCLALVPSSPQMPTLIFEKAIHLPMLSFPSLPMEKAIANTWEIPVWTKITVYKTFMRVTEVQGALLILVSRVSTTHSMKAKYLPNASVFWDQEILSCEVPWQYSSYLEYTWAWFGLSSGMNE